MNDEIKAGAAGANAGEGGSFEKKRPDWDEYFMQFAELARTRSTCLRRGVGAAIVKDNRVIATGYNGVPRGIRHCSETGCLRQQLGVPSGKMHELCRGLHAEQNAIIQAASMGSSIEGGTLYCTTQPCVICTKMIINAGIRRVVIKESYPDELAQQMADEAGLVIEVLGEKH
ncbi:MAG: cytidine/deoxycytidylate deaminase family protein [Firmicutes bacterium]|nr:cytidine/deoxycytidylate deaminase family protein [Bacillota bacterium]